VGLVVFTSFSHFALLLRSWTRLVAGLGAARDGESVAISPFDVDVLLVDAWKFAMEGVFILRLADVELWLERAQRLHFREATAGEVGVVVHQPEDWWELVVEVAWEERHLGCCGVEFACWLSVLSDVKDSWDLSSKCWSKHIMFLI